MTATNEADPTLPRAGVFPSSDQFGLGRRDGLVDSDPTPPSSVRPFGLRLGIVPAMSDEQTVTLDDLHYDEERQIALVRLDTATVPWHKHTDGRTKTKTNLDGHKGPDSDVDHRED